jgi:hypothetical protein
MDINDKLVVVEAFKASVSLYPIPDIAAMNMAWFEAA